MANQKTLPVGNNSSSSNEYHAQNPQTISNPELFQQNSSLQSPAKTGGQGTSGDILLHGKLMVEDTNTPATSSQANA